MARSTRIEYEGAFYHVMNRGKGRQVIFHDERYYHAFLETLSEVHQRFNAVVHAYCLMGNHYHVLIETPDANLSRVMRHVNGVYTQRYNRLRKTDGPLFRGRYKSILVDRDAYLLQLSRYIHRNPIDIRRPLADDLSEYIWSSYPAYLNKTQAPKWLMRDNVYGMLGSKQRYSQYARYVMDGVDEDTLAFYSRGNQASVVGGEDFREWVYDELLPGLEDAKKVGIVSSSIAFEVIVAEVAATYKTTLEALRRVIKGPQQANDGRKIAMYLCQEIASGSLKEIAEYFHLGHAGSVSFITHQIRKRRKEDSEFSQKVAVITKSIMKQAT